MSWKTSIAGWFDPGLLRDAKRYHYLTLEIDDAYRWLGEFPEAETVLKWLKERDADHWRKLDEPAVGTLPPFISDLREAMRRKRASVQ